MHDTAFSKLLLTAGVYHTRVCLQLLLSDNTMKTRGALWLLSCSGLLTSATTAFAVTCQPVAQLLTASSDCRSNATHIAWRTAAVVTPPQAHPRRRRQVRESPQDECCCSWQTLAQAQADAYHYLRQNVWPFDVPFLETMGFSRDQTEDSSLPDGLSQGLIGPTIQYALKAKMQFEYADALPKPIWQEYVLNPFHLNEARSNWRPFLWDKLTAELLQQQQQQQQQNISSVVHWVNQHAWRLLEPSVQ